VTCCPSIALSSARSLSTPVRYDILDSLTAAQSDLLESLQKRAMSIIFPGDNYVQRGVNDCWSRHASQKLSTALLTEISGNSSQIFFFFALYFVVLICFSTTVLYLSIRLLLVSSVKWTSLSLSLSD